MRVRLLRGAPILITSHFYSSRHNPQANQAVADFVSHVIWRDGRGFNPWCSMGVLDGDDLIAGVVYTNVDADAGVIELSAGAKSRRWVQTPVMRMMMGIPFDLLGCQMAVLRVKASNAGMLSIARRFGFAEIVLHRGAGRNEDMHIFSMTDDGWAKHPLKLRAGRGR